MPLVRIDVIEGRTPEELRTLADSVHHRARDRAKRPGRARPVTEQGRDEAQKTALYSRLAELVEQRGVARAQDVVVSVVENTRADWSFGFGRAEFLTGEL